MPSPFSELRKLGDDVLAIVRSPGKMHSLFQVPLYANALYLMMSTVGSALLGFVFWIIAARLYSAEAVGIASAIISAAGLLALLSGLGFDWGLLRFSKSSNNPIKLINSSFTMTGLLSLAAGGIFIIGLGIWSPRLSIIRNDPLYMVTFLFFVLALVFDDLANQVMIGGRLSRFMLIHTFIFSASRLALLVLLSFFFQSLGIFGSYSAAMLITLLVSIFLLLPRAEPGYRLSFMVDRKVISEVLQFSFLNYLSDLFWTMPGLVLPIIVVNLIGAESNAYFYVAWTMSSILTMIPVAVATSLLAESAFDEAKLTNHILRSFKMITVLLVPAVVVIWFLGNKFLLFYGGLYAQNATTLLHWLSLAAFPFAVNIVYFNIKRVQKKVKPIILLAAFMVVITVLVSYLLLPRWGINGVGIGWLSGQSAIALIAIVWDIRRWVWG